MGVDLPDDILVRFSNAGAAYDYLTTKYPDIPLPSFQTIKYETTITPLSSGWYKFFVAADDYIFVFVDDKFVGFDLYTSNKRTGSFEDGAGNLSGWLQRLSSDPSCPYDKEQICNAQTQFAMIDSKDPYLPEPYRQKTLAQISNDFVVKGNLNSTIGYYTIINDPSETYLASNGWVADAILYSVNNTLPDQANLRIRSNYYSSGGFIYLKGGSNYKLKVIFSDQTPAQHHASMVPPVNTGGESVSRMLFTYYMDDRNDIPDLSCVSHLTSYLSPHINPWESLYLCADVFLSANKTTHYSDGTPIPGYARPNPLPGEQPYYTYRTEKYWHRIDFNTLISGVMWNESPLSDVLSAEQLEKFKDYTFVGGGAYFQHKLKFSGQMLQLFSTRDLPISSSFETLNQAFKNTYYSFLHNYWSTSPGEMHSQIYFTRMPVCTKGPTSFS